MTDEYLPTTRATPKVSYSAYIFNREIFVMIETLVSINKWADDEDCHKNVKSTSFIIKINTRVGQLKPNMNCNELLLENPKFSTIPRYY